MQNTLSVVILILTLALLGCRQSALSIDEVVFGRYVKVTEDRYEVVSATEFSPGDTCGWVATVRPSIGRATFKEVYVFPAPMMHIEAPPGIKKLSLSEDRRKATIEGEIETGSNILGNSSWTVDPDDPKGIYTLTVSLNDTEIGRFTYSVGSAGR